MRTYYMALALCLFAPGLLYAAPVTQIFVLHSYSQEYPWTHGQHDGFIQALSEDVQVNAAVSTEYLDTKRHTYDEAYTSELIRHFKIKYQDYKPAAIYVTDDNALLFARDHLSGVFPGTPVFFSGVNDYGVQSSLNPSLFTGVFEQMGVAPNLEWLLRMDKDANDLIFICDDSDTYQEIERQTRNELRPYGLRATFIAEKRLDRALARLQDLPGKYLIPTTLGAMTDARGRVLPMRDTIERLVLTGRILISLGDNYIVEGVLGGAVTSGREQGMTAARLLLAHLHGKPIVDLPPIFKTPITLIFDDRALQHFGLNLPKDLRDQAVILNPRPGLYERHRVLILGSLIGLAALLFWVVTGALAILTRKNRELDLARNSAETANTLFKQLAEQSRTVHWEVDAEGMYTQVSAMSYAVLGHRPEELVNKKHFFDLFPEEERDADKTAVFELFARKEPFHGMEKTLLTKDGQLMWTLANGFPVLDDIGTLTGYRGSARDITNRKRAERALLASEMRFRGLVESSTDWIWEVNEKGVYTYVSPRVEEILGYSPEEVIGKTPFDLMPPEEAEKIAALFMDKARRGKSIVALENVCLHKNGSRVVLETNGVPMFNAAGKVIGYQGVDRDITNRKQAEAERAKLQTQLMQAQKMEAIGTLAGGIAHRFNNALQVITGNIDLLEMDLTGGENIARYTNEMKATTRLMTVLTTQLLAYARGGKYRTETVRLSDFVKDTMPVVTQTIDSALTVETDLPVDIFTVKADPVQMQMVLSAVLTNASEAMKGTGCILVACRNEIITEQSAGDFPGFKPGAYASLTITDDGEGMDEETVRRVFEPFFTTKFEGRGLGMAAAYGFVKNHGGYIRVDSESGKGTTVTIYLPAVETPVNENAASKK